MHLERAKMRVDRGGHSAPESELRRVYDASINNLPRAIREIDFIYVYDNSRWGVKPLVLLQAEKGELGGIKPSRSRRGWLWYLEET
jgi:predicted ABC-type ATPase